MVNIQDLWNELKKCDQLGGSFNGWCKDQVRMRWFEKLLGSRIYPWINLSWNYQQYVKNNYDPRNLGIRKEGNMRALIANIGVLINQLNSLLMDPNPDGNSVAGISDQPKSNNPFKSVYLSLKAQINELKRVPSVENTQKIAALKDALQLIEKNRQISAKEYGLGTNLDATYQPPPYSDDFFNKPLRGKNSSSYFAQTGFCKTKDNNMNDCKSKGHSWIGDVCYKGKYVYLDNSPGLKIGYVENLNGLIPSVINQAMQLNPNAFMGILKGYSVPGIDIQQCMEEDEEENEHFQNNNNRRQIPFTTIFGLLFVSLVAVLFIYILKK
jgi:hypothetical protein